MIEYKIITRKAEEKDLFEITEIYNDVINEGGFTADLTPVTINERKKWFFDHQAEPYNIYVLEASDKVIGYFYFSPWRYGR